MSKGTGSLSMVVALEESSVSEVPQYTFDQLQICVFGDLYQTNHSLTCYNLHSAVLSSSYTANLPILCFTSAKESLSYRPGSQGWTSRVLPLMYIFNFLYVFLGLVLLSFLASMLYMCFFMLLCMHFGIRMCNL